MPIDQDIIIQVQENDEPIIVQISDSLAPVQAVNGKIGWVTIDKNDVGLSNVENVSILGASGNIQNQINNLDNIYASDVQLSETGQFLNQKIDNLSGYTNVNFYPRSNPSGFITGVDTSSLYPRSNPSGFITGVDTSSLYPRSNPSGFITGVDTSSLYPRSNPSGFITGVDTSSLYPRSNPSGFITGVDTSSLYPRSNPSGFITGVDTSSLYPRSNPSGFITGVNLSAYVTTGQTGNFYPSSNPSGFITGVNLSSYATITNLNSTGNNLQNQINSLSGSAVLLYGDQTIDGTKTFRNSVYIHDLYVTGTEFIANVENNFIESPYILLNLTGGAVDGGIFFVTGTGLTGINDYGAIIGFDHTDKFKFGIARRSDDLSTLDSIAGISDITDYSGFANNNFYLKSNPSGFVTNTNLQELQISLSTGIENYTGTFVTPFSSVPTVVATMLATQGFNYMAALTSVTTTNFVADFSDVIEETGVTLNIIAYN
jgi:hypothetical protein